MFLNNNISFSVHEHLCTVCQVFAITLQTKSSWSLISSYSEARWLCASEESGATKYLIELTYLQTILAGWLSMGGEKGKTVGWTWSPVVGCLPMGGEKGKSSSLSVIFATMEMIWPFGIYPSGEKCWKCLIDHLWSQKWFDHLAITHGKTVGWTRLEDHLHAGMHELGLVGFGV